MTAKSLAQSIRQQQARPKRRKNLDTGNPGRALAAVATRERVQSELAPYLETLRDAIPELWPRKRLFDGCWVLGLDADLPFGSYKGRPYEAFSRLDFALRIDPDVRGFEVTCSTTVYDRDEPTDRFRGTLEPASLEELGVFVEHHCLLFATRFFERRPRKAAGGQDAA